ncbi:MAG: esterase-like activity of phytase family protein [Synechococcales cyanobacterium]
MLDGMGTDNKMYQYFYGLVLLCWLLASGSALGQPTEPIVPTLVGYAVLPAQTFAAGDPCGQFDGNGVKAAQPRFDQQPVQGISSLQVNLNQPGHFWALVDNGFGTQANSPDFELRIYDLVPEAKTAGGGSGTVQVVDWISLRDPEQRLPFRIVRETTAERLLTGADLDPEALVLAEDGSFWIGDEFGPYLVHVSADGVVLEPPFALPELRSPQHPRSLARSPQPGSPVVATFPSSGGFEGLTRSADGRQLYGLLEKAVPGDDPTRRRLYPFDLARRQFQEDYQRYVIGDPEWLIGEISQAPDKSYWVIERDNLEGDEAQTKQIVRVRQTANDWQREAVVNLLQIRDPDHLAGFGPIFRFPFITIESVVPVDAHTLLVVNDNNYPASGGRSDTEPDNSEWIWIHF